MMHLSRLLHLFVCAELGIDIPSILMKTKAILLHQMKANTLDELDFGGALVFLLALGCLHLMVSRAPGCKGDLTSLHVAVGWLWDSHKLQWLQKHV
jgi:hypothetical protein